MRSIVLSEQDKAFLMSLAYAAGIIIFWRGIWNTVDLIPILNNPLVSLFLGLAILSLTGWIYTQFDAFSLHTNKLMNMLTQVLHDEQKGIHHFLSYFDEVKNQHRKIPMSKVRKVEQTHVVIEEGGREFFVPIHRISAVHNGNKMIWQK